MLHGLTRRTVLHAAVAVALAVLVAAGRPAPARAADQIRIGVIDFQRVLSEVIKGTPEYRDYQIEKEKRQLEFERRRQEIEKLARELEENKHLWSEEKVREHTDQLRERRADARYYAESVERFTQAQEGKLVRRMLPDMKEFLTNYGTREGYSIIIDKLGLYYFNETIDITDDVIKELTSKS